MHNIINIILFFFILSCNPVKKILKDNKKFEEIAKEVIKSGRCANDTIVYTKTNTIYKIDTSYLTDIKIETRNDTVYRTEIQYNTIRKKIYIRDTIKNIVIDQSQINVLKKDIAVLEDRLNSEKEKSKKRFNYLFVIIVVSSLYVLYKFKRLFIK